MHDCDGDGDDHLPSPLLINLTHEHILNAKTTDVGCPSACTAKESKTSGQTRPPFPPLPAFSPRRRRSVPPENVCAATTRVHPCGLFLHVPVGKSV